MQSSDKISPFVATRDLVMVRTDNQILAMGLMIVSEIEQVID